jgi:hypothetical protein
VWRKCSVRVFAVADNEHDQEALREDVQKFLYDLRMEATVRVLNARDSDVCFECHQQRSDIMSRFQRARKRILQHNGLPLAPVATIKRRTVVHASSEQELAAHAEVPSRHHTHTRPVARAALFTQATGNATEPSPSLFGRIDHNMRPNITTCVSSVRWE